MIGNLPTGAARGGGSTTPISLGRVRLARLGFRGSLQDFFKYVRTDPKFYYPDTPQGRAQYIGDAKALLAEVRARAREVLDIQPKADVEVRPYTYHGTQQELTEVHR